MMMDSTSSNPNGVSPSVANTDYHSYQEPFDHHTYHNSSSSSSSAYYESASKNNKVIIDSNHHHHHHHDDHQKPCPSLNQFLTHSTEQDDLHFTVREYLTNRRRRTTSYGMCCVCFNGCEGLVGHCIPKKIFYHLSSCCLRIPVVDLINENVFYRFVVWFLFARLYFSAIYVTRVWQWFADDRMDNIIVGCDYIGDTR